MSRPCRFHFVSASSVEARGWRVDEYLEQASGRRPVWSSVTRSWSCQAGTAMDAIAIAEARGRQVEVTGVVPKVGWSTRSSSAEDLVQVGLW